MTKASPARVLALEVIRESRVRGAYAKELLNSSKLIKNTTLSESDSGYARVLSLGVISTSGTLSEIIDRNLNSPRDINEKVRDALMLSVYELLFLQKPAYAVLSQGVELVRYIAPKAAGLANKVLRRTLEDLASFPFGDVELEDAALARNFGFPLWLAKRFICDMGRRKAAEFMELSNMVAPVFVAPNILCTSTEEIFEALKNQGAKPEYFQPLAKEVSSTELSTITPRTIVLKNPSAAIRAEHSINLFNGQALIADASVVEICKKFVDGLSRPDSRILEIGSGRGTKTILIAGFFFEKFGIQPRIDCIELHEFKTEIARARLKLFGVTEMEVHAGDATKLEKVVGLSRGFDAAFIDAPCSGTGTLRRHPEIRWRLKEEEIAEMATLSGMLIDSAMSALMSGGKLLFATCSTLREENEDVTSTCSNASSFLIETKRIEVSDYHFAAWLEKR